MSDEIEKLKAYIARPEGALQDIDNTWMEDGLGEAAKIAHDCVEEVAMTDAAEEYLVDMVEDRPASGMWHCGPNAVWATVTHLPTMICARMFDTQPHKAREAAMACCQMMVDQSRMDKCQFPERLHTLLLLREPQ